MADTVNNGGAAFPSQPYGSDGLPCGEAASGLTKREYFAAQAAAGLLAHPKCLMVGPGYEDTTRCVAREAFAIADAMLEAGAEK